MKVSIWFRDCCTERFGNYVQILLGNGTNPIDSVQGANFIAKYGRKTETWGQRVGREFYGSGGAEESEGVHSDARKDEENLLSRSFLRTDDYEVCGEMTHIRDGDVRETICEGERGSSTRKRKGLRSGSEMAVTIRSFDFPTTLSIHGVGMSALILVSIMHCGCQYNRIICIVLSSQIK